MTGEIQNNDLKTIHESLCNYHSVEINLLQEIANLLKKQTETMVDGKAKADHLVDSIEGSLAEIGKRAKTENDLFAQSRKADEESTRNARPEPPQTGDGFI